MERTRKTIATLRGSIEPWRLINLNDTIAKNSINLHEHTDSPALYYDFLRLYSKYACVFLYRGDKLNRDGSYFKDLAIYGEPQLVNISKGFIEYAIQGVEQDVASFREKRRRGILKRAYYLIHGNEASSFYKKKLINKLIKVLKKELEKRNNAAYYPVSENIHRLSYAVQYTNIHLTHKRLKPGYGESKGDAT